MPTSKDSFSSDLLTIDEIRWIDANADADVDQIQYPVTMPSRKHPKLSSNNTPVPRTNASPIPLNELNGNEHYNCKTPSHLQCVLTPPTPIPTPPPESPSKPKAKTHRSMSPTHLHPFSVSPPRNLSTSSPFTPPPLPQPKPSHHPEWIYRRPKSPRARSITPTSKTSPSPTRPRSHTHSHTRSHSEDQHPFWSSVRPRSRADRSVPMLQTKPSAMHARTPSISSIASTSTATTISSRSETPTSPSSKSRRTSPGPSKSILTRTSSIATKNSASTTTTCNKSVKFVDMPTIHYASTGYWDMEGIDVENMDMRLREDMQKGMDVDMRDAMTTPTPEREKEKTRGLARFIRRNSTRVAPRPTISGPFALGSISTQPPTLPPLPPLPALSGDNASIHSTSTFGSTSRLFFKAPSISGPFPLRSAPSLESFRSAKSTGGRSARSMGSVRSNERTGKFRAWLERMGLGVRAEMGCGIS